MCSPHLAASEPQCFVLFASWAPEVVHGEAKGVPSGPQRPPRVQFRAILSRFGRHFGAQVIPRAPQAPFLSSLGQIFEVFWSCGKARWREGRRQVDPPRHAIGMTLGVLNHLQHPPESGSEENPYPYRLWVYRHRCINELPRKHHVSTTLAQKTGLGTYVKNVFKLITT